VILGLSRAVVARAHVAANDFTVLGDSNTFCK
jgi:hypothetical protein